MTGRKIPIFHKDNKWTPLRSLAGSFTAAPVHSSNERRERNIVHAESGDVGKVQDEDGKEGMTRRETATRR